MRAIVSVETKKCINTSYGDKMMIMMKAQD